MAKLIFFAALLATLVGVSVAQQREAAAAAAARGRFGDDYARCQREVQENPLEACRNVVDRQLAGRSRVVSIPYQSGLRRRCCQQLEDISRECRCAAIRRMVRDYDDEQAMAPLEEREESYPGEETAEWRRRRQEEEEEGEGFYGEREQQQEEEEGRYGVGPPATPEWSRQARLSRVRQYAARLPAMCQVEPQGCSVFFPAGQW